MRFRNLVLVILCAVVSLSAVASAPVFGQGTQNTSGMSTAQRLDVMRSRLDVLRRTLNSAIAGLNARDGGPEAADDPRARLRGLEKEVNTLLTEVADLRGKQERAERFDPTLLDKLEASVTDLDTRVQAGMLATASDRRTLTGGDTTATKKKKKGGFFSRILGGGDDNKYEELIGTVAPGRDKQLFEDATKEARDGNYETARPLYTVIITTYPESAYLPLAKLAIADTFYLEGTTSALIQAGQAYQDWFTFFPTHPLADDVMLKMAEVEMRRMGLPDRDVTSARKAEQRLKVFMQQFPQSSLRPDVEVKLREVQENLGMHNLKVGNHYYDRYFRGAASNPKGAQSRYREIVEKYPNFSLMDTVLFRYGITYVQEEEPDEAAKYFQRLVREYPNSEYADKAREQLTAIGAPIPDPDPERAKLPPNPGPSFIQGVIDEVMGRTPRTINKNGVLISSDEKTADLIEEAIKNGGTLPDTYNTMPVNRSAPARRLTPSPTPVSKPADDKKDISVSPTQPGPPRSGNDPTNPTAAPSTQTMTPSAPPPTNGNGVKP
ncbi:MAG TPA: outer membrane protein assembly factor BamD [Pyrinomonadaceae bacterium]|jgi:outer membrane protein assembly factor BamD|nr:outer membrane protein assembly factor BamD [Pyrinomonadaceae bacterium]